MPMSKYNLVAYCISRDKDKGLWTHSCLMRKAVVVDAISLCIQGVGGLGLLV